MEFERGTCPKCKGELQIPKNHSTIICMYCGKEINTLDALENKPKSEEPSLTVEVDLKLQEQLLAALKTGMLDMLEEYEKPMLAFNRKGYADNFRAYCDKYQAIPKTLDMLNKMWGDSSSKQKDAADSFVDEVKQKLDVITPKRKMEDKLLDYNMIMVVFVFPALLENKNPSRMEFSKTVAASWKEHFPQTNIETADYEQISSGFKRRFCYITTAVCESLNKPDDCYELNVLRGYRDGYLMSQKDGEELVKKYYDIAPTIVKHINKSKDKSDIYQSVWLNYLSPCIHLIEEDKREECMQLYQTMVYDLQEKYFA